MCLCVCMCGLGMVEPHLPQVGGCGHGLSVYL